MARIVLASGSPRRQELLQRIGIRDFTIRVPQVEEWYPDGLTPEEIVCYISREKSQAVPSDEEEIVITADTMVFLDDKKLGKPADESEALAMLTALQGRHHTVCTGVTVRQGQRVLTRAQSTHVFFAPRQRRSCAPTSPAASRWTRRAPTVCRGRAHCWWSASTATFQCDGSAGAAAEPYAGGLRYHPAGLRGNDG